MNWDWEKLQEKRQRQSRGGGGGGGTQPPDFGEFKKRLQNLKNFNFPGFKIALALIVLLWLASGFYIVNPAEVGVVQRFGAFTRITQSGPHYHLPYPVESVKTPNVTEIRRIEVGFRSSDTTRGLAQGSYRKMPKESLMLTGDENIVDVQVIVQYRIKEAQNFLFNITQPEKTVKDAAEAAIRDVVGNNEIEAVLTAQKFEIQNQTMSLLQEILDSYNSGMQITAVKLQDVHPPEDVTDAFKDVASAREDRSRLINQAAGYRNDIIPKARGRVASMLNEAEAYKESKIRQAKGESVRFLKLWEQYQLAQDVTRKRLYLEAMEEVFSKSGAKMLLTNQAADQIVPYLPLDQLQRPGMGVRKNQDSAESK